MMGKSKRFVDWEGTSAGPSEEREAGENDLDEEIIDLEEVIEPHGGSPDQDDELVFDVEILDEGTGLGFEDLAGKIESEEDFLLEGDLLKDLPFFENRESAPEPPQAREVAFESPPAPEVAREGIEKPALGLLLERLEAPPEQVEDGGEADESERIVPDLLVLPIVPEAPVMPSAPEVSVLPVAPPAEASVSLDEFVAQIESRLVETIREMVAARLPEIVRTVLKEEIERLKDGHEPEA